MAKLSSVICLLRFYIQVKGHPGQYTTIKLWTLNLQQVGQSNQHGRLIDLDLKWPYYAWFRVSILLWGSVDTGLYDFQVFQFSKLCKYMLLFYLFIFFSPQRVNSCVRYSRQSVWFHEHLQLSCHLSLHETMETEVQGLICLFALSSWKPSSYSK